MNSEKKEKAYARGLARGQRDRLGRPVLPQARRLAREDGVLRRAEIADLALPACANPRNLVVAERHTGSAGPPSAVETELD